MKIYRKKYQSIEFFLILSGLIFPLFLYIFIDVVFDHSSPILIIIIFGVSWSVLIYLFTCVLPNISATTISNGKIITNKLLEIVPDEDE